MTTQVRKRSSCAIATSFDNGFHAPRSGEAATCICSCSQACLYLQRAYNVADGIPACALFILTFCDGPWSQKRSCGLVCLAGCFGYLGADVNETGLEHMRTQVVSVSADAGSELRELAGSKDGTVSAYYKRFSRLDPWYAFDRGHESCQTGHR